MVTFLLINRRESSRFPPSTQQFLDRKREEISIGSGKTEGGPKSGEKGWEVVAIPCPGCGEAIIESDLGLPIEKRRGFCSGENLSVNLMIKPRGLEDFGRELIGQSGHRDQSLDQFSDLDGRSASEVEGLAGELFGLFGEAQVALNEVLDMDQLTNGRSITLDDRRLSLEEGEECPGDDSGEVEVGWAVDIGGPADGDRELIGLREGADEEFCADLGDGVRRDTQQGEVLGVGENRMNTIRFVAGGDDDSARDASHTTGFEKKVGSPDIGVEGGQGGVVGRSNDRLGGEVKDCVDSELAQELFDEGEVLDRAFDYLDMAPEIEEVEGIDPG
jgi:hypothetical protein